MEVRVRAFFLLCCLILAISAGCAPGPSGRLEVNPVERRVDAVPGRTLVVPVELAGPLDPDAPIDVRLDDGRRPAAGLYWISVGPEAAPDPRAWLAPAGQWMATPISASSRPSAAGVWAVVLDLPADSRGQGLWLQGRRTALNWIDALPAAASSFVPPPRPPAEIGSAWLGSLLAAERRSPARRWRWRLVTSGLEMRRAVTDPAAFDDPILEALAAQTEDRWAAALAALAHDSPDIARELVRRLGSMVEIDSVIVPAWPADSHTLDNLLDDLLSPGHDATARATRVSAWLAAQPPAIAWVADDGGHRDAMSSAPVAAVGIANLLGAGVLAGLAPDDGSVPANLTPLEPSSASIFTTALGPGSASAPVASVRALAGAWEESIPTLVEGAPVSPPGLRIGPLLADWTMQEWMTGMKAPPGDPALGTALVLMRDPALPEGWALYLESMRAPGSTAEDVVRIWLGPSGSPTAILRASSDGMVVDEAAIGSTTRDPSRTPVAMRSSGRWMCKLIIPPRCIEADGALLIGIERVDPSGQRSAWPRPMLPWQAEPGRIRADTAAWGDLGDAVSSNRGAESPPP
jgi:hypothetical protein